MDKKGLGKVLNLARRVCEDSGERFTEKREQIFKILDISHDLPATWTTIMALVLDVILFFKSL